MNLSVLCGDNYYYYYLFFFFFFAYCVGPFKKKKKNRRDQSKTLITDLKERIGDKEVPLVILSDPVHVCCYHGS